MVRRAIELWPVSDRKMTLSFLLKRFVSGMELDGLARHQWWVANLAPPMIERLTGIPAKFAGSDAENLALLDRLQRWDLEHTLAEGLLTKADRASMSSSLELRAPFLDAAVMEFAGQLPAAERVKRFQTKIFLKQYALRYLPRQIVRRRKRGLSVPIGAWLRGPLRDWAGTALQSAQLQQIGVSTEVAQSIFAEHLSGRADHARALWTLMVLSEWLDWVRQETACDRECEMNQPNYPPGINREISNLN